MSVKVAEVKILGNCTNCAFLYMCPFLELGCRMYPDIVLV
jgi:hypothetical protein